MISEPDAGPPEDRFGDRPVTGALGRNPTPPPGSAADGPINAAGLLRFGESLRATLEELRGLAAPLAVDRFTALVAGRLAEADRLLPPDLAGELRRLLAPGITEQETDRDLRVLLAQLDGWIAGLAGQMIVAVPEPPGA